MNFNVEITANMIAVKNRIAKIVADNDTAMVENLISDGWKIYFANRKRIVAVPSNRQAMFTLAPTAEQCWSVSALKNKEEYKISDCPEMDDGAIVSAMLDGYEFWDIMPAKLVEIPFEKEK